jgi:hypothetical protein
MESFSKIYGRLPHPKYMAGPETLPNSYASMMNGGNSSSVYNDYRGLAEMLFNGDMFGRFGG